MKKDNLNVKIKSYIKEIPSFPVSVERVLKVLTWKVSGI